MSTDKITITEKDFLRITNLINSIKTQEYEDLEVELDRASIVADNEISEHIVTMNSKVRYVDLKTRKESIVTIVYPQDVNTSEGKISVLAPLGSALIGLEVDQEINWRFPNGSTRTLKILEILYQPEKSKDWHL